MDLNRDTVLNANTIPQIGTQPIAPVRVRALLFWRVAGEQWITGTAVATSPRLLLIEPDELIDRDYPLWLPPADLRAIDVQAPPDEDDRV